MHDATGPAGESIVCDFLRGKGYKILERNYRTKFGEIDIVAKKAEALIFVEVKTMEASDWDPELHFTAQKMVKMKRTVRAYLKDKRIVDTDYQLDLIALELGESDGVQDIRHYENITM